jgi:hypothetical protein
MRAPPGAKHDESGAKSHKARGERLPYPCRSAKQSADTMQEVPA